MEYSIKNICTLIFIRCFAWCILFVGDFSHNVHDIPNFATILIKVLFINILSMEWIKLMSIKIEIKQYNCSFSSFRIFRIKIHWKLDFSPLWIVECRYICMGKWGGGGWVRENLLKNDKKLGFLINAEGCWAGVLT